MSSGQWDMIAMEALEREALEQYAVQEFPMRAFSPALLPPPMATSAAVAAAASINRHHQNIGGVVGVGAGNGATAVTTIGTAGLSALAHPATVSGLAGVGVGSGGGHHHSYLRQPSPQQQQQHMMLQQQQQQQHQFHPSHNCPLNPHHHGLHHHRYAPSAVGNLASAAIEASTGAGAGEPLQMPPAMGHHHLNQPQLVDRRAAGAAGAAASLQEDVASPASTAASAAAPAEVFDVELQDHIKHCTCTCNHMGYGNFMDYQQTTCFSGLPDVTEPSNHLQHQHQQHQKFDRRSPSPSSAAAAGLQHHHHHHQLHHPHQQHHYHNHHQHQLQLQHNLHQLQRQQSTVSKQQQQHHHKSSVACRDAGGYIIDFMHQCKAPASPMPDDDAMSMSMSPSRTTTVDDIISAKSDTDLSGGGGGFDGRGGGGGSSGGSSGKKGSMRRRSFAVGGGGGGGSGSGAGGSVRRHCSRARGLAAGLQCVSCSVIVAIVAVVVLLGLAIALSVADVDVVAGWFGGGRSGRGGGGGAGGKSSEHRMRIVRRVLQETPLIDGHNDLPWNIRRYAHNRLENLSFADGLQAEPWSRSVWSQTDWPRLRAGLVGAQFWSAYVPCAAQGLDAVQVALEQIDLIHRFTDWHAPRLQLVRTAQHIVETHRTGHLASLIGVEGGHALGSSLSVLRSMYTLGVRYLTLTYTCDTQWAGSVGAGTTSTATTTTTTTTTPTTTTATLAATTTKPPPPATASPLESLAPRKGLSPFGRAVVREMNRLGMMIDLAHSSDATVRDVLRESRAPVIFSHSAARALCNSTRNVPDDTLREVADNGGIVMVSFDAAQVACLESTAGSDGQRRGGGKGGRATMADVVAHINYVRAIAGVRHIGIGAGYDGIASVPTGLEDVAAYPRLFAELLRDPNWTEADLHLLAGRNLLRVLRTVETVRDYLVETAAAPTETLAPRKQSPCTNKSL